MNKLLLSTAVLLTLSGCVVGPPPDNERDRRAYGSMQNVHHDDHGDYYEGDHAYGDANHDGDDDYNPHTGQDRWEHHNN